MERSLPPHAPPYLARTPFPNVSFLLTFVLHSFSEPGGSGCDRFLAVTRAIPRNSSAISPPPSIQQAFSPLAGVKIFYLFCPRRHPGVFFGSVPRHPSLPKLVRVPQKLLPFSSVTPPTPPTPDIFFRVDFGICGIRRGSLPPLFQPTCPKRTSGVPPAVTDPQRLFLDRSVDAPSVYFPLYDNRVKFFCFFRSFPFAACANLLS